MASSTVGVVSTMPRASSKPGTSSLNATGVVVDNSVSGDKSSVLGVKHGSSIPMKADPTLSLTVSASGIVGSLYASTCPHIAFILKEVCKLAARVTSSTGSPHSPSSASGPGVVVSAGVDATKVVLGGVNLVVLSSVHESGGISSSGPTLVAVPVMTSVAAVGPMTIVSVLPVYDAHVNATKCGKASID